MLNDKKEQTTQRRMKKKVYLDYFHKLQINTSQQYRPSCLKLSESVYLFLFVLWHRISKDEGTEAVYNTNQG